MNDFLGRLAARAQGEAAVVMPRLRSRYEAGAAAAPPVPAPEGWSEEVVEAAGGTEEARAVRDVRERRREEVRPAPAPEAPVERRMGSPEPAVKAVEPREARLPGRETAVERAAEAAARPAPAPAPAPMEERPRPVRAARKAGEETVAAPPEAPAPAMPMPAPRRGEPRLSPPPEPGPRPAPRAGETGPAAPAPPEARPAVRASRPAEPRTAPLPTVGPRREIPHLAPAPSGIAGETEEVVRVAIGRIDVHAGPPPVQAPAPRRPADPRLSLSDYLAGRNERRRR